MIELPQKIKNWDNSIREGKTSEVREALLKWRIEDIPRARLAEMAQLAWRSGDPDRGILLLRPQIRVHRNATDPEILEYAACLLRVGLLEEALELLTTVPVKKHPRAMLYRGYAWMARWGYREALTYLRHYLSSVRAKSYEAHVANANIAACLVFLGKYVAAKTILQQLLHETALHGYRTLLGNAYQLSVALFVQWGKLDLAESLLKSAREKLPGMSPFEMLLLEKWSAIASLYHLGATPQVQRDLESVKAQALEQRHWETLRDCDWHFAARTQDKLLLQRLYFGTPYPSFRERLEKNGVLPATYRWEIGSGKNPAEVDWLVRGRTAKSSSVLDRLFAELAKDFYRPAFARELYSKLFPGEYYHPDSSIRRIHEAVRRLKELFQQEKIPLTLNSEGNGYRLEPLAPVTILIPRPTREKKPIPPAAVKLHQSFGANPFSAAEAAKVLEMPLRSTQRLFTELVSSGVLKPAGKGKGSRYLLPDSVAKSASLFS